MDTGTLTSKGQTTVPKRIREFLGLRPGDRIAYRIEDGRVVLIAKTRDIQSLVGMLPKPAKPVSLKEMDEGIAAGAVKRFSRK